MNTTGKPQDLLAVIELEQDHFQSPWTVPQWESVDWNTHQLFTHHHQEKLRAFALFGMVPGDSTAHLYKILIHPELRGSTLTAQFWSDILDQLKGSGKTSIYLEVAASNERAIRFYEKQGFSLLRRNKAYYSSGEDALMMSLTL